MSLTEEQQQQVEQQNAIEDNRANLQASADGFILTKIVGGL